VLSVPGRSSGKIEQSVNDRLGPPGGIAHLVEHAVQDRVAVGYPLREIVEAHQEDLQGILHLVRDAAAIRPTVSNRSVCINC